jgi:hypothetical protein
MADIGLHPATEHELERARRVRVAAIEAGRARDWPVPQGLLDRIEAVTAGSELSQADAEQVAVCVVERARLDEVSGMGPRSWDASNREANGHFRVIFGQVVYGEGWLTPALAAREGGSGRRFDEMPGDISNITPHNFVGSHYHQCGLDYATFDALRREGFNGQNIINAARDTRSLGFRATDRDRVRDLAIIDRHSTDARGNVRALHEYRRRTEGDSELQALIAQRQRATSEAEQRALDAQIAARRLEHERASGLHPFINDPTNDPRASAATKRTKDAIDRYQEQHRLNPDLTEEQRAAARARVGLAEVRRADREEVATTRQTQSEAEIDRNLLATMGVTPSPAPAANPATGISQPAIVVRQDAPTPVTPPASPATIVQTQPGAPVAGG